MKPAPLPFVALVFAAAPAVAVDRPVADTNGFVAAVNAARPGDRVLVRPGDYGGNLFFRGVVGTAAAPIVIAAADPKNPPRFVGKNFCVQFSGPSYLELRDLNFTGARENGLNIDDGGRPDRPSRGVVLKNLRVRYIGPTGNADGIKLSGLDDFTVENCLVERWGSGYGSGIDMVGCHRGLIVGCTFLKGGGANAVQAKGGSSDITVRGCRFEDAGERAVQFGGSTDDNAFRPPLSKLPANAKYEMKSGVVEGCTFVNCQAAVAFVGVDGATFRFNTVVRPGRYALRILQEKDGPGFVPSRNGVFEDNVVVFQSGKWVEGGVNVGPGTDPKSFKFARNAWYCEDRPDRSGPSLPTPETDGVVGKDPQFRDAAGGDYTLKDGSPAAGKGAGGLK